MRSNTLVVDLPVNSRTLTDKEKLEHIRAKIDDLLRNRLSVLSEEAAAIESDMEVLRMRISTQGSEAQLEDIKSARWYHTASQTRLLQTLHRYVYDLLGADDAVIQTVIDDDASTPQGSLIETDSLHKR